MMEFGRHKDFMLDSMVGTKYEHPVAVLFQHGEVDCTAAMGGGMGRHLQFLLIKVPRLEVVMGVAWEQEYEQQNFPRCDP
jgi:hypothetical protein